MCAKNYVNWVPVKLLQKLSGLLFWPTLYNVLHVLQNYRCH